MRVLKGSVSDGVAVVTNQIRSWSRDHRQIIASGATSAITVAWLCAPEPSGKIVGAALIARNLATLGFGSMRLGLAIATAAPALAGSLAGKVGAGRKSIGRK